MLLVTGLSARLYLVAGGTGSPQPRPLNGIDVCPVEQGGALTLPSEMPLRRSGHLATQSRQGPASQAADRQAGHLCWRRHTSRASATRSRCVRWRKCAATLIGLIATEGAGDCCEIARRLLENAVGDAACTLGAPTGVGGGVVAGGLSRLVAMSQASSLSVAVVQRQRPGAPTTMRWTSGS